MTAQITKPVLAVLERCFAAEIFGRLPAQMKSSKALDRALRDELLEPMTRDLNCLTISGYNLTHRGRYLYCQWASEGEDP